MASWADLFRALNVDRAANTDNLAELLNRRFDPNTLSKSDQAAVYLAMREDSPSVAELLLVRPD